MSTCTFCRIVRGELVASRLWEEDLAIAFLDISPVNPGHSLVVPRRHVTSFTDLDPAELESLARVVQRVASALKSAVPGCEGVTVSLADGEAAGQEIPHAHFHVIPRHAGDGFGWRRFGEKMDRATLDQLAFSIRNLIR